MSKRKDLTGTKFGKLTVLRPTKLILNRIRNIGETQYKEYLQEYECRCDCGNVKITTCNQLKSVLNGKGTSSCGCSQRRTIDGDKWSVSFNMIWKNYVCHAVANKRAFSLTKEEFNSLIKNNCHYCNNPPQHVMKSKSIKKPDITIYNGIDRVNNNTGYTLSNCVTCCEICNKMKLTLDQKTFKEHIKLIYKNLS